jgi:hypothetical protein
MLTSWPYCGPWPCSTWRGWIEAVKPRHYVVHVLAHQALQFYGVRPEQVWEMAQLAQPFSQVARAEFEHLLDYLVETDILSGTGGLLVLGEEGERPALMAEVV